MDCFPRLRCVQFDPIAPAGCNHDLVFQSRVPGYRIGDWVKTAYEEGRLYDGWDKQASLIPFPGWPLRRVYSRAHREYFEERIFRDHADVVEIILRELAERGPLLPRDFDFQMRRDEWTGSWFGPSVTKQTLRALWHTGLVMTAGRKGGQHLYDLAERVVPPEIYNSPPIPESEAIVELAHERHVSMGLLRPGAPYEIWSLKVLSPYKHEAIAQLVDQNRLIPVVVEGMKFHAPPEFLATLDEPPGEPQVRFVAPLDQFMWDRRSIRHIFEFDYIWEIYTPEPKRRWGYYVLPIVFGDRLVARVEFWARQGMLEIRQWHEEAGDPGPAFWGALEPATLAFMEYCSAYRVTALPHIPVRVRRYFAKLKRPVPRGAKLRR